MNKGIAKTAMIEKGKAGSGSAGYLPSLDGLRALAVFAVIAYHLNIKGAQGGLLGVSLFFVLSGYLITDILLAQQDNTGSIDLADFWLRRARRLLPGLFLMLLGVLAWIMLFSPERLVALKGEMLAAVCYSSNWYLILHHVSYFEQFGPPSPLGHLWSLAVEEQFYLIWPLLLGLGLRCIPQRKWLIRGTIAAALASFAAMAVIFIPGSDPSRVYYGTDTRAFALLIGAALAMILPARKLNQQQNRISTIVLDVTGSLGLLIVLWMIGNTNQYQTFLYRGGFLLFSAATACLVAALARQGSLLGKLFGFPLFRWLGECSYGIYLWHYPVIVLTSPAVDTVGTNPVRSIWQIAASIALAALSRYLIEDPIRYGRKKTPGRKSSPQGWKKRSAALAAKAAVSILLIIAVLFVTSENVLPTSASAMEESRIEIRQAQLAELHKEKLLRYELAQRERQKNNADKQPVLSGADITAIGDSLMVDIEPALKTSLPGIWIDGKIGRQMHQAPEVIDSIRKDGHLKSIVILELGTNGAFTEKQLTETLDSLKDADKIILINTRVPRPWESVVNETLQKYQEYGGNVILLDWYTASTGHDEYFYSDGVHLNNNGVQAYGKIILDALETIHDEEQ